MEHNYLVHANHKYISKERVKGRWKYVYEGEGNGVHRRTTSDNVTVSTGTGKVGDTNHKISTSEPTKSKKVYSFKTNGRTYQTDDYEKYKRIESLDTVIKKNDEKYKSGSPEGDAYRDYTFSDGVEKLEEQIAVETIRKYGASGMPTEVQNILVENADKNLDDIIKRMSSNKSND